MNECFTYLSKRELRLTDLERRLKDARAFIEEHEERIQAERKQLEEEKGHKEDAGDAIILRSLTHLYCIKE